MGEARLRGSFEDRKCQAIAAGRKKLPFPIRAGGYHYYQMGGSRNSGIFSRKPHRFSRPWKRIAAGK